MFKGESNKQDKTMKVEEIKPEFSNEAKYEDSYVPPTFWSVSTNNDASTVNQEQPDL